MTHEEVKAWLARTESSRNRWTEDEIFRLNGHGVKYYRGGESGKYVEIHQDGRLEIGEYDGAIPHIGEAFFQPVVRKRYEDFDTAFKKAAEFVGADFPAAVQEQSDDLYDQGIGGMQ